MFTLKSLNKPLDYIKYIGKYLLPVFGKKIGKVAYTIDRKTLTNGNKCCYDYHTKFSQQTAIVLLPVIITTV